MKAGGFDEGLLEEHRRHLYDATAASAFDVLVSGALAAEGIEGYPAWHGDMRVFHYDDLSARERPFAFIVNRRDLLFYVRKAGFSRLGGGFGEFGRHFPWVTQNPAGEWTLRIRTPQEAAQLNAHLFGSSPVATEPSGAPWAPEEIDAVVADYFQMLVLELNQQRYSKAARRRALLPRLHRRSEGSIEFKHQNISAVLLDLGAPWILNYKPRQNYQRALFDAVADRLERDFALDAAAAHAVDQPAAAPDLIRFADVVVAAPAVASVSDREPLPYRRPERAVRRDYLGMEARNRSLGLAGEEFVVAYERHRLNEAGARRLVEKVEHVAKTRGDGLGYDVLSFDTNGRERLIEVKTTAFGREAPFYLTRTELGLSKAEPEIFRLCRLFEFRKRPQMFELTGALDERCRLDPVSFLASFK